MALFRKRRCDLVKITFTSVCVVLFIGQVRTQDVGSFLAGLLGSSEVPRNETDPNQVPCPGECVHAITSILCSKVIEQFNCGASFLRCCVSSDFNFGTVVETSAPLPEEASTTEYDFYLVTTEPSFDYDTKLHIASASTTVRPSKHPPSTIRPKPCPGICVENVFVRYCGNTITHGWCEEGATCCSSSADDQQTSTNPATPDKKEQKSSTVQYVTTDGIMTTLSTTTYSGPPCPGSCVAPLFSLLCDAVNDNYFCANDGRCCVNREPETTTSYVPPPKPCNGACIPVFLSGMCNQPSELVINTDCEGDYVCCFQSHLKDHPNAAQIPLLRPHSPPMVFPPIPVNAQINSNQPPGKPTHSNQHLNRPHLISGARPMLFQHPHNHPNNGYVGGNHPSGGYLSSQIPSNSHHESPVIKVAVAHNDGGSYNPNQQGYAEMSSNSNNTMGSQPIRIQFTPHIHNLAPHNGQIVFSNDSTGQSQHNANKSNYPQNGGNFESSLGPSSSFDYQRPAAEQINDHKQLFHKPYGGIFDADGEPLSNHEHPIILDNGSANSPFQHKLTPQKFSQPVKDKFSPPKSHFSAVPQPFTRQPLDHGHDQHAEESKRPDQPTAFVPFKPTPSDPKKPLETGSAQGSQTAEESHEVIADPSESTKPSCPGTCIASFLRFTCFGSSTIYEAFSCADSSAMCCTPLEDVHKYEAHRSGVAPETSLTPAPSSQSKRPSPYVCGIKGAQRKKTARVVGGRTSSTGEWCWQVALINDKNQYLCGGALIGSRWVLTAAHCVTALVRNGDSIYVRVGDFDLASRSGSPGAQTQKVSTSYIHHNHNGQTLDNDIALLRLENPVQLQETVCLVCLPARGTTAQPGKRCTVTGYGYQSESGPIALKIREAVIPIVEENLCSEQVNKVTEKRFILPAGSFCAGGESGNDACQGDGGGPMTCENDGYHELTGLVSWGFGCGKENVPGVYVKVSAYIGWINQIISVNN